jgi:hypothetical protein
VTEQSPLKLVISYDRNRNEYSVAAHNLTNDEAQAHVTRWTPHLPTDCSFILLDQSRTHRTTDAQACRACRETVARSAHLEPQPKFTRRTE